MCYNIKRFIDTSSPIGIFDSGIGGLSVLHHIQKRLPNENICYFRDTENAPYGSKSADDILKICEKNVEYLISLSCKLIVIACNTATAVSVEKMRKRFEGLGIVGLEPALRPAAESFAPSDVLVVATPLTLSQERFVRLKSEFETETEKFICVPLQETVLHVENNTVGSAAHIEFLERALSPYKAKRFLGCVLGCTHFPFAKKDISRVLGYAPEYFDGGEGSAKRAEVLLRREGILNENAGVGKVLFIDKYCEKRYKQLISSK